MGYLLCRDKQEREDIGKKLLGLNAFLLVLDLVWVLVMGSVWGATPDLVVEGAPGSGMHLSVCAQPARTRRGNCSLLPHVQRQPDAAAARLCSRNLLN